MEYYELHVFQPKIPTDTILKNYMGFRFMVMISWMIFMMVHLYNPSAFIATLKILRNSHVTN